MKTCYVFIESERGLRAETLPTAKKILKEFFGLKPQDMWVHAARLTRYHTKRSLMMELSDRQHATLVAHVTGKGATPVPEVLTLVYTGNGAFNSQQITVTIDMKFWSPDFNDGRNRGIAQPRIKNQDEYTNLEGN